MAERATDRPTHRMHARMHTASLPACLSVRLPAGQPASPSSVAPPIVFGKLVTVQHCFIVSVCPLWQTPGTPHRMQSDNVGRLTQRLLHRVGRCPLPGRRRPDTWAHGRRHDTTRHDKGHAPCCVVLCCVVHCAPVCWASSPTNILSTLICTSH